MLVSCYNASVNDYSYSTLFSPMSLNEDAVTLKRMSASMAIGETTNGNITLSLFELPKETIEKIEKESKLNKPKPNQYEHQPS